VNYYIDLFSPETYERFSNSDRSISGFRPRQKSQAQRIHPGDILICYMTKFSRWIGVLEVTSEFYIDDTPIFSDENDPFIIRFNVKPICWLPKENTIPIHDDNIWHNLSFTRDLPQTSNAWTGRVRGSLGSLNETDGVFLENVLVHQWSEKKDYPIDELEYQRIRKQQIKRTNGTVSVTVPEDVDIPEEATPEVESIRESLQIQSKLAYIGEKLGFRIWIPRSDRGRVLQNWVPQYNSLLESLPLNYDEITLRTIEQIDIIWLRGRSIIRAFEIEHTTSVYSGILRMADLLALQPNMDIKLHIVAPQSRKEKVFQEIQRPVFSLLEKGPLSELCSYLTYESIKQIKELPHLARMMDSVIEDYEEFAE
jgi:predicted RNA-binding protein